ncbi:xylulokinase [Ornithinimicrobium humiphilum]|uniref:Xylulose kinase n=1 Tax=Ornithinimicrobium humiphilum TaxID=125288 RepID=A0A543KL77_9MICO|nr:xylulokinase [Ornithinimicrobium humiphilum]TQM95835.1 xylulokinase [Ornithinimicrobium humiphilum]
MALVAGVDSSTQSCKVVVRDAETGELVRSGRASHPDGTEVDPHEWWRALTEAVEMAGGLEDVSALAVGGQQHGMVALDEAGEVVRPALLWNDTRSAPQARRLVEERGARWWAGATGSVPVASYTVTKLAWMHEHEPDNAARTAAVALPHDWLTWRLVGSGSFDDLVTDRSDASGTGYWSPRRGTYLTELVQDALGHEIRLPRVLGPAEVAGTGTGPANGIPLGPGAGDNAAAALGLGAGPGDVVLSVGTSGVVSAVTDDPTADVEGIISGFADATGRFLPLAATLNAARVLDATARMLGTDVAELDRLAAEAPAGADGLVLVPYLEGERTPNLPDATGSLHGLTLRTSAPAHLARAAVESIACLLADAVDAFLAQGVETRRFLLVGGGARSLSLRQSLADVLGSPILVPTPDEYVANGAARQAAWVLSGAEAGPEWPMPGLVTVEPAADGARVRERYAEARSHVLDRVAREA